MADVKILFKKENLIKKFEKHLKYINKNNIDLVFNNIFCCQIHAHKITRSKEKKIANKEKN